MDSPTCAPPQLNCLLALPLGKRECLKRSQSCLVIDLFAAVFCDPEECPMTKLSSGPDQWLSGFGSQIGESAGGSSNRGTMIQLQQFVFCMQKPAACERHSTIQVIEPLHANYSEGEESILFLCEELV
jgi:hypothetical protein